MWSAVADSSRGTRSEVAGARGGVMKLIDPRTGMEHLDRDDCLRLLAQHQGSIGRLALIEGAHPTIVVVNYAMVEDKIVFRSGVGTKQDVADRSENVAFEVDRI